MRAFLFVCLLFAAGPLLGCELSSVAREAYVLNRIGYGADPWSRQRLRQLGVAGFIEEQLHPERIDDSAVAQRIASLYPSLSLSIAQALERYPKGSQNEIRSELSQARVLRALRSRRQLEQVLVEFWFDHFNVNARSEIAEWAIASYERDAIRPYVLGRFEDMVRAVAMHPAMLEYLDNAQNFRPGFTYAGLPAGPNENFARELLELHTVGTDAGYTLSDVRDLARIFTGWTTRSDRTGFDFLAAGHDTGSKRVLGLSIPAGGGSAEGEAAIRYLARHSSTAARVAYRLCERFVAENPPADCVLAGASRFAATGGDLRAVMRAILLSDSFVNGFGYRNKMKRPVHAVVSMGRVLGVADDARFADVAVSRFPLMGEDPYGAPAPFGWPEPSARWAGEGALLERWNFAFGAAVGSHGFAPYPRLANEQPVAVVDWLQPRLIPDGITSRERDAAVRLAGMVSKSTRVYEVTALLLSSASFTLH